MKHWGVIAVLGSAQFVMVLDGTVMNVSISTVVSDLDTPSPQCRAPSPSTPSRWPRSCCWARGWATCGGRRRAFVIGSCVYAGGSLITALSPNVQFLFLGWSIVEGLGAVLVIPAIAALVADNYRGSERITAFAIIGACPSGRRSGTPDRWIRHDVLRLAPTCSPPRCSS